MSDDDPGYHGCGPTAEQMKAKANAALRYAQDKILAEKNRTSLDGQAYDESGGLVASASSCQVVEMPQAVKDGITKNLSGIGFTAQGAVPPGVSEAVRKQLGFITRDSGQRSEFDTGARRDCHTGKGRFDLIPPLPIKRLAQLFERGAVKYGDRNWEKGIPLYRYLDSAARHLNDFLSGDRVEDHLTAVIWNCMCYIHTEAMIESGKLPKSLLEGSK